MIFLNTHFCFFWTKASKVKCISFRLALPGIAQLIFYDCIICWYVLVGAFFFVVYTIWVMCVIQETFASRRGGLVQGHYVWFVFVCEFSHDRVDVILSVNLEIS